MELRLTTKDLVVLCLVLSVSFFLLGLVTDNVLNQKAIKVSSKRLVPIYKVDTAEKKIAITLDGMWGAKRTPQLLKIFRDNNIKVTFFFGGNWLEENSGLVKEIVANGHEIGNHSYTHPHMAQLSQKQIEDEIIKTEELIKGITGERPILFRPPFGEYNNQVIRSCEKLDYYPIQWSIDSLDWKDVSSQFIIKKVLDNLESGDIILMHNNGKNTPQALYELIPKIKKRGYKIVPVSKLIYKDNYYIESHSGVQKSKLGVDDK